MKKCVLRKVLKQRQEQINKIIKRKTKGRRKKND